MATRLKVDKSVLLARLRSARARSIEKHREELASHDAKVTQFAEKLHLEVVTLARKIEAAPGKASARVSGDYRGGCTAKFKATPPSKPQLDTRKLDRLVRTLEAATDTVIPVSADDDFAAYL